MDIVDLPYFVLAEAKSRQWRGNKATFTHHAYTALCSHHLWRLYFVIFTFVKMLALDIGFAAVGRG